MSLLVWWCSSDLQTGRAPPYVNTLNMESVCKYPAHSDTVLMRWETLVKVTNNGKKKKQHLKHWEETEGGGGRLALWTHLCCLHCCLCRWSLHRNQELIETAWFECWRSGSCWEKKKKKERPKNLLRMIFFLSKLFLESSFLWKKRLFFTQNQSLVSFISSSFRSWGGCWLFVFTEWRRRRGGDYSRTLILWYYLHSACWTTARLKSAVDPSLRLRWVTPEKNDI